MGDSTMVQESVNDRVLTVLVAAAKMPGVHIDRVKYLRASLQRYCDAGQVELAVVESPAAAGVPHVLLDTLAGNSIRREVGKSAVLSAAAGMPGALAMPVTLPLDMTQYVGHMVRIVQKLAYLYSWPDLFESDGQDVDDATFNVLILFMGVMLGAQGATSSVGKVSSMIAEQLVKTLPRRALTKGTIYPLVKKVASLIGVKMTEGIFAKGVGKAIPVIGGLVSGGITAGTLTPMSHKLRKHLASLDLAQQTRNHDYSTNDPMQ